MLAIQGPAIIRPEKILYKYRAGVFYYKGCEENSKISTGLRRCEEKA